VGGSLLNNFLTFAVAVRYTVLFTIFYAQFYLEEYLQKKLDNYISIKMKNVVVRPYTSQSNLGLNLYCCDSKKEDLGYT